MSLDSVLHMLQRVLKRAANAVGGLSGTSQP